MHQQFRELIEAAIANESMADLQEVLHYITNRTQSFGCILWQVEPTDEPLVQRQLFALAEWFRGGVFCRNHHLPIAASVTGRGVLSGEPQHVSDIDHEGVHRDRFLTKNGIRSFFSQPIVFRDGTHGALNVYRNRPEPFDEETCSAARELAMFVPLVYEINRHRAGSKLMMDVSAITQGAQQRPRNQSPFEFARPFMREICDKVARALHCDEVTVFLEDVQVAPGEYNLAATTWYDVPLRTSYRADEADGLTGWSLKHWQVPVRILELREFDDTVIQRKYPGMRWLDSWDLRKQTVLRRLHLDDDEDPPYSFMSAPLIHGGAVVGILRCSVGLGPKYFAAGDHRLLQTISAQLASWWGSLLVRRNIETENESFKRLGENVVRLNDFVYAELQKVNPESKPILTSALRRMREVIPAAEINDVRLLSEDGSELRFAEIDGKAWKEGSAEEVATRQQRVYKANGEPSVGAHVVQTGKTYVVKDVQNDPYYFTNFPNARRMIVAPVMLTNRKAKTTKRYGVLDVRGTVDRDFPDYARGIAELLGSQIALYLELAETIRNRNEALRVRDAAVTELTGFHEVEVRFHEEIAHQFRSPINIALMWVREAMRKVSDPETLDLLRTVRGACTRAKHVSSNSMLFARLSRGQGIPVSKSKLVDRDFGGMLINTGVDAARLHDHFEAPDGTPPPLWSGFRRPASLPPEKRYSVDTDEFETIKDIFTDRDLLEQAVTQILDNAFKYSWPWTVVHVRGGLTLSTKKALSEAKDPRTVQRRMRVAVWSQGVPLLQEDVDKVVERGWQAEQAKEFRQAGSGLGMWIVNEILLALGGSLEVKATNDEGWTEIAMVLPIDDGEQ